MSGVYLIRTLRQNTKAHKHNDFAGTLRRLRKWLFCKKWKNKKDDKWSHRPITDWEPKDRFSTWYHICVLCQRRFNGYRPLSCYCCFSTNFVESRSIVYNWLRMDSNANWLHAYCCWCTWPSVVFLFFFDMCTSCTHFIVNKHVYNVIVSSCYYILLLLLLQKFTFYECIEHVHVLGCQLIG